MQLSRLKVNLSSLFSDCCRVELGYRGYHTANILSTCGLVSGVHSELRKADVDGGDGYSGVGDRAEGGATGEIRSVAVGLHGYTGSFTHGAEEGVGEAVGGISLVSIVLDDHAAVKDWCVVGVGHLGA